MAHFAKIGINSKVIGVYVVNDSDILNADGIEDESVGQQYLERHNNWTAEMWIQTSYNTLAGTHKNGGNIFYPKKPYASWVLNTTTATWHSPIGDAPDLTNEEKEADIIYQWNEDGQSWDKTTL